MSVPFQPVVASMENVLWWMIYKKQRKEERRHFSLKTNKTGQLGWDSWIEKQKAEEKTRNKERENIIEPKHTWVLNKHTLLAKKRHLVMCHSTSLAALPVYLLVLESSGKLRSANGTWLQMKDFKVIITHKAYTATEIQVDVFYKQWERSLWAQTDKESREIAPNVWSM